MPYYLLPIWAGVFADSYHFSGAQIGPLLAADMVGGTVAAVCARFWIARARWRPILTLSLLFAVFANLLCVAVDSFETLLLLRTIAGLSAGTFMAFVYAEFSHAEDPDRNFSIALALQVVFGAAAISLAPEVLAAWGRAGSFVVVGLLTALPIFLITACPERGADSSPGTGEKGVRIRWRAWLGLTTICLFFISLTCVWVAMERLATAGGMGAPSVAIVMSAALLFSFLGAAAPALTSSLWSRRLQINIGYLALIVAIFVIGGEPSIWLLASGLIVYNFFFSFVIPCQTAWVAETDKAGRNAVLVPVAQGIGVSLGPVLGGSLLGSGNYAGVIGFSIGILVVSFVCAHIAGDPIRD